MTHCCLIKRLFGTLPKFLVAFISRPPKIPECDTFLFSFTLALAVGSALAQKPREKLLVAQDGSGTHRSILERFKNNVAIRSEDFLLLARLW